MRLLHNTYEQGTGKLLDTDWIEVPDKELTEMEIMQNTIDELKILIDNIIARLDILTPPLPLK